jgi:DNA-directed RNA polymerase specialized sigma54-like protein
MDIITLQQYKEKILGIRNYQSKKNQFFVDDFTDLKRLELILLEILIGESDITPAGKKFLHTYYIISDLVEYLFKSEVFKNSYNFSSKEEITNWIENMVPMEINSFIVEARTGITPQIKNINKNLLPPH